MVMGVSRKMSAARRRRSGYDRGRRLLLRDKRRGGRVSFATRANRFRKIRRCSDRVSPGAGQRNQTDVTTGRAGVSVRAILATCLRAWSTI